MPFLEKGTVDMRLLTPDVCKDKITEIDINLLNSLGVKGLIIDLDNTSGGYDDTIPPMEVVEWAKTMTAAGVSIYLLSNNSSKDRVSVYAESMGINGNRLAMKPMTFGIRRALRIMGFKRSEVCLVGDQIFTDVLAGKFCRMRTILVTSVEKRKKQNRE